ncbi:MAG: 60 kDa inner rane insertion protein preprotein translocase subunit YidC [Parcubacteria group bacterium]|nr:60 kDa inner rane insertion protein preprotein translocase subunit YidC [Parcubacteria group bacterium]
MISSLFHSVLYVPIYNLLIFFTGIIPGGDVGIAVIIVTIIVKVVTAPLSISAAKTQRRMKHAEPQMKAIKEKYKDDKQKQATETMALYKNNGIKPFSSIFAVILQLPIIIALYLVFRHEHLLTVNLALVYPFVALPVTISPLFLHIFATTGHSITLAIIAAASQFLQARLTIPVPPKAAKGSTPSSSEEFARALAIQSRLVLPILIGVFAYTTGAIALYFITSSVVALLQEFYLRRTTHVHATEPIVI